MILMTEMARGARALVGAAAMLGGLALSIPVHAQSFGSIQVKNQQGAACSLQLAETTPNGNLTFTVNCGGGGGGGGAPVCTGEVQNLQVGQSATVTANCTNNPTTFSWHGPGLFDGNPPRTSSTTLGPFPAGQFVYTVRASNSVGEGTATHTINVGGNFAPTCSPTVTPANAPLVAGGAATLTANCATATSVNWTAGAGAPAVTATAASQTITFPTAGTYTYTVTGTNAVGTGPAANLSVTVGTQPQNGSCPAVPDVVGTAVNGNIKFDTLINLRWDVPVNRDGKFHSGTKEFVYDGATVQLSAVAATQLETPKGTWAQYTIAECPGVFDGHPKAVPSCSFYSSTGGNVFWVGGSNACQLTPGATYHVNMRFVSGFGSTTPGCTSAPYNYCANYLKFN